MNIIELAEQANGEPAWNGGVDWTWDELGAFAKLVAAHEREAIAKLIEDVPALVPFVQNDMGGCLVCGFTPKLAAKYIRARGTT